jgi:hypothetical protein
MSAVARIPMKVAERNATGIADLTAAIRAADSIEDLKEARARVEAMKAWAKVHNLTKQMRLELLHIEVAALVRIVELGGEQTLKPVEAKAAVFLAAMDAVERVEFINANRTATTAFGLCQSVWREDEIRLQRRQAVVIGRKLAEEPEPPVYDEEAIKIFRDHSNGIAGVLAQITDEYITNGVEFTIDELADEIIADSLPDDLLEDETINKGVREVVREAVRRSPPLTVNGTVIPRVITARSGRKYIRIPVMNATVAHLDDMIMMREQQIKQDCLAVDKLKDFANMLRRHPDGSNPTSRIGDLIASAVTREPAPLQ